MTPRRPSIHWAFVPLAVVSTVAVWIRQGPIVALLLVVAGLGLGFYGKRKGAKRRGTSP